MIWEVNILYEGQVLLLVYLKFVYFLKLSHQLHISVYILQDNLLCYFTGILIEHSAICNMHMEIYSNIKKCYFYYFL
jgi:hypothetical protein